MEARTTQPSAATVIPLADHQPEDDHVIAAVRPADADPAAWHSEAREALEYLRVPPTPPRKLSGALQRLSVVAFLAAATWLWNWELALILVALIFVHELGHKLLMQYFGYHDVQMFFVPLFGAAVRGIKENATQTQRALVALAGPLPGILIAAGAALFLPAGEVALSDPRVRAISMALLLNGLNLLPFVPLDGGRFFSAVLYSHYPPLETCGKLASAVLFLLGGHYLNAWPLFVIGALILLTTPATHRIAVLSRRLRREGAIADAPLHELSAEELLKNYRVARAAFSPASTSLTDRLNLLRRAYSATRAQPASAKLAVGLLLLYALGVAGTLAGLWSLNAAFPPEPEFYPLQMFPAK